MKHWTALLFFTSLAFASPLPSRDAHAVVWLTDGRVLVGHHDGILQSKSPFKTWRKLLQQTNLDAMNLTPLEGRLRLTGHGIFGDVSLAGTFTPLTPAGLPTMPDVHGYTRLTEKVHYALIVGLGVMKSQDAGQSWKKAPLPDDTFRLLGTPRGLTGVSDTLGLFEVQGNRTVKIPTPYPVMNVQQDTSGRYWLATAAGVFVQDGKRWKKTSGEVLLAFAVHAKDPTRIFGVTSKGEGLQVQEAPAPR
ncbi:hypothetical protein [Deinococcus cellulosilyticus]|uniref:S-layer protein n=1 Tax=Deinococcus cellulosilyticus (strain DSM 18568 / NBRC 106333 / KACC 11606 / 5516J-15) TaxID=1223518 RepID=A0A511N2P8_DEIC1|nr:hypothetical protein [Deinococcus cellulosilyticus]GEM46691.1 S-layer protein [Deinococcus cellulosilyticus NBRC 106333 = KACC 11606]